MVQSILDAISLGGLYALEALGLGLVFGVMRLVNFAHGELITIAAYTLVLTVQFPLIVSILITVIVTSLVAFLMELTIYRRLRGVNPAIMLIASFGLSTVLQRVYELIFGALPKSAVVAPFLSGAFSIGGLSITISSVITVVLTVIILLAMGYLVERTSLGLQLRAAAADFKTARLLGVRANRLISAAFVLSGILASCVAFILVIQNPEVNPYYGLNITILALVGIVIGGISSLRGAALGGFVRLVDHMREATRHNTLPETVEFVIQHSGLIQHYLSEREGQDRVENLQELINAATAFIAEEGYGQDAAAAMLPGENAPGVVEVSPLAAFLSHASLEAGDNQAQAGQDAVQLMTVHSAKGLEFTSVFITGLEEGLFPHENSVNEQNGLEEERRLMYVAITRAKERLYLSHTQSRMLHGQVRYNMPSRFLEELPSDSLKWLTPKARDARWGGGNSNSRSGSNWQDGYTRQREYESNDFFDSGSEYQKPSKQVERVGRVGSASMEVKRLASPPRGNYPFTIGQNVFHTKFGEGRVTGLEGVDADARAQVNFKRHGVKWLQLSIAKLAAID